MSGRQDYIHGLRYLADRLERNPDCPLPHDGTATHIAVYVHDDNQLRAAAKAIGGERVTDDNTGFRLRRTLGGLRINVVPLYGACERVQVGTQRETRIVEQCRCGAEIVSMESGARGCSEWYDDRCYFTEAPQLVEVVDEVPVYETRCPESLLRPGAEQAADDDEPDTDAAAADAGALA